MKRTIGLLMVAGLLLVIVSAELFGAAGHRMTRLVPEPIHALSAESAYVSLDTLWSPWAGSRFYNLDDWRYKGATRALIRISVATSDADIDSCEVLTRFTDDGLNHVVVDSQEVTGSTTGSAMYKDYPLDSLYGHPYMQILTRAFGDAAGTAIQTIWFRVSVDFLDYQGRMLGRIGPYKVPSSFQE